MADTKVFSRSLSGNVHHSFFGNFCCASTCLLLCCKSLAAENNMADALLQIFSLRDTLRSVFFSLQNINCDVLIG